MRSTWSAARRIFSMRSGRHAQIEGETKCTVGIPSRLKAVSMPRLKSGASTPIKARGCRVLMRLIMRLLSHKRDGSFFKTSTYPITERRSLVYQGKSPASSIFSPPIPNCRAPPMRRSSSGRTRLARKSPLASPASQATPLEGERDTAGTRAVTAPVIG